MGTALRRPAREWGRDQHVHWCSISRPFRSAETRTLGFIRGWWFRPLVWPRRFQPMHVVTDQKTAGLAEFPVGFAGLGCSHFPKQGNSTVSAQTLPDGKAQK